MLLLLMFVVNLQLLTIYKLDFDKSKLNLHNYKVPQNEKKYAFRYYPG